MIPERQEFYDYVAEKLSCASNAVQEKPEGVEMNQSIVKKEMGFAGLEGVAITTLLLSIAGFAFGGNILAYLVAAILAGVIAWLLAAAIAKGVTPKAAGRKALAELDPTGELGDFDDIMEMANQCKTLRALFYDMTAKECNDATLKDVLNKALFLDAIPTPIFAINDEFDIQLMTPFGAEMIGQTAETVRGSKCYELFKTPICNTPDCPTRRAMEGQALPEGETVADPSGINLPIEYMAAKINDGHNRTIGAMEAVFNISDRKNVLKDIIAISKALAAGDLTVRARDDYDGDYRELAENLNLAIESLKDTLANVSSASDQVRDASAQISSTSQSLANGASDQASSIEQISSSLEEISSRTRENVGTTQQVRKLAGEAEQTAREGNRSMEKMSSAMKAIQESSENTAKIINAINDIAFQTNLLALNAAVEAARVGEAGKGFAVVAQEVRELAGRAKSAAQETEKLINESVTHSKQGAELSEEVNIALTEIVDSVGNVTRLIEEITTASEEQAKGVEQVNLAVTNMDTVVQQNAAVAEESSSASEELNGQAEELASMIRRFKLDKGGMAGGLSNAYWASDKEANLLEFDEF